MMPFHRRPGRRAPRTGIILALVASVLGAPRTGRAQEPAEADVPAWLREGSALAFRLKRPAPLGKILAYIVKKTGSRIRIVNEFGLARSELLEETHAFDFRDATFWEGVSAIAEATGTVFAKLDGDAVVLTAAGEEDSGTRPGKSRPIGDPVRRGAVLVIPEVETFFGHLVFRLRAEPRAGRLPVPDGRLRVTPAGSDEPLEIAPSIFSKVDVFTNETLLVFDPDRARDAEGNRRGLDAQRASSVELRARVRVPLRWTEVVLPPLGKLLGEEQTLAGRKLRVVEAGFRESEGDESPLHVRLLIHGEALDAGSFRLLPPEGDPVSPQSSSSNQPFEDETIHLVQLRFPRDAVDDPAEAAVGLEGTEGESVKLGPGYSGRWTEAGAVRVLVYRAVREEGPGGEAIRLRLEVDGAHVDPESVALVGAGEARAEARSSGWTGSRPQTVLRGFDPGTLRGPLAEARPALRVPVALAELPVELDLEDVELPGD